MARFAIEHEFGRRPAARGGQVAALRVHPSLPGVASGAGDAPRPPEKAPLDARTV
jgi:hypothetical protein